MALFNKLFFPTTSATSAPAPTQGAATATNAATPTPLKTASNSWTSSTTSNNKRHTNNQSVHSKNYLSQFPFDGRQVRVLLYRECDSRGRRLLFDSQALEEVSLKEVNGNSAKAEKNTRPDERAGFVAPSSSSSSSHHLNGNSSKDLLSSSSGSKQQQQQHHHQNHKQQQQHINKGHSNGFIEINKEVGYKHNRPTSADITSIGEMVFGALAMSFRGTAFKVHWLQSPSSILCSQVFLSPVSCANGQSPHSTISMNSAATPRHSISSEYGSIDGLSMNSLSMPYSVSVDRHMSLTPAMEHGSTSTHPLDVPDRQSLNSEQMRIGSGPRYSTTYSTGTDSGYSGMSRMGGGGGVLSSDQWSSSYQYSTRSSLGSVTSDHSESLRKLSMDSSCFPASSPYSDEFSSDGSLQRRISRNLRTSFENENSMSDFIGFISDNYPAGSSSSGGAAGAGAGGSEGSVAIARRASYCANESRSNPEIGRRRDASMRSVNRRARLGLAVCILMSESFEEEMELFCSEHIALLESMLSRLRAYTERAYINHKDFLQIMFHAWQDTQKWVNDLFTAPRIKCPVWLSITTSGSKYSKNVAKRFIDELCWLLSLADTKDTNFFISTMLTAILTHHLGWVSTVSAFSNSSSLTRSETSAAAIEQRAKLLEVSQKHPYNALWAQMGDLYGAIGMPPKLTRTVVYGTEKLSVERLLNILTYFIRCGEVRRSAKREDFNKELVKSIVSQNQNETLRKSLNSVFSNKSAAGMRKVSPSLGLTRTQTCKQNLNTITDNCEMDNSDQEEDEEDEDEFPGKEIICTLKKNEIPNVLAFRDSRFVQQELRIGNYLMDTGILKSSLLNQTKTTASPSSSAQEKIRLTITTPDNVEMPMEVELNAESNGGIEDGAVEAIEIECDSTTDCRSRKESSHGRKNFFWQMVPSVVKEGFSLNDLGKLQNGVKVINRKLEERSSSFNQQPCTDDGVRNSNRPLDKQMSQLSLSDLITQNSIGKSDRMTWGIEPIKENICLEEHIHFDLSQKLIEREHGISRDNGNDVVFVLGDNEPLVNLKKSTEDLASTTTTTTTDDQMIADDENLIANNRSLCPLHQQTHGSLTFPKKHHSGVKFNFETYPQIATNYMKSKNLVMSNYDFLMDKCKQQEAANSAPRSAEEQASTSNVAASSRCVTCVVCNSILNSYQTPSNATELEFETDEDHCYVSTVKSSGSERQSGGLPVVNSAASVDTLKSTPKDGEELAVTTNAEETAGSPAAVKRTTYNGNSKKLQSQRCSTSSVAAKCAAVNEAVHLLKLPVPSIKELPQEDEPPGDMKLRAGFIPSLFLNVSDHYISDMVLQGTCASPKKWEMNLREDLALAAHSASLISLPAENVAIVADMENWDVRLISSQAQCFPYAGGQSAPVGMSQLVSSMLETVQAMNSSGISAYECLSFLESKLQEIYLQSETLAAFLLDTDFCQLSAVTTALNLSENDVPLLLSVASIHTPQISKKCGISFR